MTYKYATAWDWLEDRINRSTGTELRFIIRQLAHAIDDPEAIINALGQEMDEDGYFEEVENE